MLENWFKEMFVLPIGSSEEGVSHPKEVFALPLS